MSNRYHQVNFSIFVILDEPGCNLLELLNFEAPNFGTVYAGEEERIALIEQNRRLIEYAYRNGYGEDSQVYEDDPQDQANDQVPHAYENNLLVFENNPLVYAEDIQLYEDDHQIYGNVPYFYREDLHVHRDNSLIYEENLLYGNDPRIDDVLDPYREDDDVYESEYGDDSLVYE